MKQRLIEFCHSLGLDTMGMIPCRKFEELRTFYEMRKEKNLQNEFEEKDIEKRINPMHYMEEGKTILSIAFPYNAEGKEGSRKGTIEQNGFSVYTRRLDYHKVVKKYLNEISGFIETLGGKTVSLVDSNTLPERYIAYLAGIGFIGRNNMIITERYGSYVFLGEIITDLELECVDIHTFHDIKQYKECGTCDRCQRACPSRSINKHCVNPNICLSYLTQKKDISEQEIKLLKGNVFGCDFCQLTCPYNEKAKKSPLVEFQELDYMSEDAEVFANMDNKFFKEKVSQTSCGWRGKNVIRRNAMIHLAKEGENIEKYRGDSPYINEYIDKICKMDNRKIQKKDHYNENM